jgi:hypothetical protein
MKPSLSVYYNAKTDVIEFSSIVVSSKTKYNVMSYNICAINNHNAKIGKIFYNGPDVQIAPGDELTSYSFVIYLPQGNINCLESCNGQTQNGYYLPNTTYTFPIISGTGHFLNVTGFVNVVTDDVGGRFLYLYFNK